MALFKFTKNIIAGQSIPVFNHGNHTRDFTFIEDIAEGVIRSSDQIAKANPNWDSNHPDPSTSNAPFRIFNIGNNQPVKLMTFIEACRAWKAVHGTLPGRLTIFLEGEEESGSPSLIPFMKENADELRSDIALICDNLLDVVDKLGMAGVPLATAPNDVYYEMLDTRLPGHGQPVPELQSRGILLDGTTADGTPRLLLQIFSTPMLGPVFFEFIQREGDYRDGFGEGNFKALFESLERDQIRRGVLAADKA